MDRQAPDILAAMKRLVDPALERYVDGLHPPMREISRFHFGWDDGAGNQLARGFGLSGTIL